MWHSQGPCKPDRVDRAALSCAFTSFLHAGCSVSPKCLLLVMLSKHERCRAAEERGREPGSPASPLLACWGVPKHPENLSPAMPIQGVLLNALSPASHLAKICKRCEATDLGRNSLTQHGIPTPRRDPSTCAPLACARSRAALRM